ncbi:MAG: hypothetical protein WC600_01060 [Desulfobaccales bacterium]
MSGYDRSGNEISISPEDTIQVSFDTGEDPIFELLPPSADELAKKFPDTKLSGYFQR